VPQAAALLDIAARMAEDVEIGLGRREQWERMG
jgi:hypothetical protein